MTHKVDGDGRRSFLKLLGLGVLAAPALPSIVTEASEAARSLRDAELMFSYPPIPSSTIQRYSGTPLIYEGPNWVEPSMYVRWSNPAVVVRKTGDLT